VAEARRPGAQRLAPRESVEPLAELELELDARLNSLCSLAQQALEPTWAEVGTSSDERRDAVGYLKEQLTTAFLAALTRETEMRDELQCELAAITAKIEQAAADLGEHATLPADVIHGTLRQRAGAASRELELSRVRRTERARTADALSAQARSLSAQLGVPLADIRGTARECAPLSAESLRLLDLEVRALRAERAHRAEAAAMLNHRIAALRTALGGAPMPEVRVASGGADAGGDDLRQSALDALRAHLGLLEGTRAERISEIATIAGRVAEICAQLGLQLDPEAERAASTDLSEGAVAGWRSELERLEKLRQASLSRLVEEARLELAELRTHLGLTTEAEALVLNMQSAEVLEGVLSTLSADIEALRARQQEAAPILRLRARRSELRLQRTQLEESMADPTRLTSRRDPGRLLREERERKVCAVEMPRVTAKLLETLRGWEERRGEAFQFEGSSLFDTVSIEEDFEAAEVEARRQQRAAPRPGAPPPAAAPASAHKANSNQSTPRKTPFQHGGTTPRSAQTGGGRRLANAFESAASAPRTGPGAIPGSSASPGGNPVGVEPFRPIPLSLQQILAAEKIDPDSGAADGLGGETPSAEAGRKTLTYRLRDEAAVAIAAAEDIRRATMTERQRPATAQPHGTVRRGPATTGHTPSKSARTVESVVALAARLKVEARKNADAAALKGRAASKPAMHGTPSKAVLRAFAESNGLASPADLFDMMSPPQHAGHGNKEN